MPRRERRRAQDDDLRDAQLHRARGTRREQRRRALIRGGRLVHRRHRVHPARGYPAVPDRRRARHVQAHQGQRVRVPRGRRRRRRERSHPTMPIAQTRGQAEDWGDRDAPADERGVARRDAVDDAGARRGPGEDGEGDEAGRVLLLERKAARAEVEAADD